MEHVNILSGDARETLKTIEAGTVHCCVTSPPYWGLRAYIDDPKEIGREPTPEDHIKNLVDVFREVRRTMRDDGICFINYGDAYSQGGNGGNAKQHRGEHNGAKDAPPGYKPKDLLSMPFRVVEALRQDGWYHRSTIIWSKKSPMPESVRGSAWRRCQVKVEQSERVSRDTHLDDKDKRPGGNRGNGLPDLQNQPLAQWEPCPGCEKCQDNGGYIFSLSAGRPTSSFEYVFLLTKSSQYFYNQDGNRVAQKTEPHSPGYVDGHEYAVGPMDRGGHSQREQPDRVWGATAGRNLWTVWNDLSSSSYKGAHFAVMPMSLALRCVKLGTSDAGCCPDCGNQRAPIVDSERVATRPADNNKRSGTSGTGNIDPERHETSTKIIGWKATCSCGNEGHGRPIVLDPFGGSMTTAEAARECGCKAIMCELNPDYITMGSKRFDQEVLF